MNKYMFKIKKKIELCGYVHWKPSRDFTRPLGPPRGLKGLLHTLNATVMPTKVSFRILRVFCSLVCFCRFNKLLEIGDWIIGDIVLGVLMFCWKRNRLISHA